MPKQYNETLSAVVRNYRDLASVNALPTDHLSNEQVWEMIHKSCGYGSSEEEGEDFLDQLRENLDNKTATIETLTSQDIKDLK